MAVYLDKTASLTPAAKAIICLKATEYPGSDNSDPAATQGTYLCKRCGLALFRGQSRFHSGCGWPSFDADIAGTVAQIADPDGIRTEIVCARCDAHLGHVFTGEHFTRNNLRHCVNSASLDFVVNTQVLNTEEAIVAGGCFWGVEYFLSRLPGVLKVESGYTGGQVENPDYDAVCRGDSGHYEAVRIVYDPAITTYSQVLTAFFNIHDPTQRNGQGPDLGQQYQSAVFYYDSTQQTIANSLIQQLTQKGYDVATKLLPATVFWPAETYHQQYYAKHNKTPYCHKPCARL